MNPAEALLRVATDLKWWRDDVIADPPDDVQELIETLEHLAADLQRKPPEA